jgi:hypothetical protein
MTDALDPDHWCNGGEHDTYHPDAMAMQKLEDELKQAIKERDEAVRQLVLVRNEYHAFFRKINNIE